MTETLYRAIHDGSCLGIGTREELDALSNIGALPPCSELSFELVGTFPLTQGAE